METKGSYADFVNKMLDEIDFLAAPKSSDLLNNLMAESGLAGQTQQEVSKHIAAAIAKYERMILSELRRHPKFDWNSAAQELDKRRSGLAAREEAVRCAKMKNLLREGVRPDPDDVQQLL